MNNLNIVYEDNHILLVEKPINVLSQKDQTNDESLVDIAKNYLKYKYNKPGNVYLGLIHRLDRPVGGLVLLAKTSKAAARLSADLQKKQIDRNYLAIVHGKTNSSFTLKNYLISKENFIRVTDDNLKGKLAILNAKAVSSNNMYSLLDINLETGRKHQIRVQLSNSNLPILNDMKYGIDSNLGQIALWAYKIKFIHPISKKTMVFYSKPKNKSFEIFSKEINNYIDNEENI